MRQETRNKRQETRARNKEQKTRDKRREMQQKEDGGDNDTYKLWDTVITFIQKIDKEKYTLT